MRRWQTKLLIRKLTSASTDDLSNGAELKAAELPQVAYRHMADSQSLHTIKIQFHFLMAGSSPLFGSVW